MPRALDQIAVDVADLLKVGDDDKAVNDKIIAGIVQQLEAVRRAHHFGGDVVKSNQLRRHRCRSRRRSAVTTRPMSMIRRGLWRS
jgi:hypothetical protein